MDLEFQKLLMDKTDFPQEVKECFLQAGEQLRDQGQEEALDGAVSFFYENDFDVKLTQPLLDSISEETGISAYTLWELLLMEAAKPAKEAYLSKGVPEEIYWDTFADLKYKAVECKNVQGVWGNFVAHWYHIFFTADIVKLGRLEFESKTYEGDKPYEKNGYVVNPGDPVKSVHIPSSGEPFNWEARLDSYKKAYAFFQDELHGKPLVCVCGSWLLYPPYKEILSPTSNVVNFIGDWDVVAWKDSDSFEDAWRVFNADSKKPPEQWPEDTSMRRSFKKWVLDGGKAGGGDGILIFDGENIVNR